MENNTEFKDVALALVGLYQAINALQPHIEKHCDETLLNYVAERVTDAEIILEKNKFFRDIRN